MYIYNIQDINKVDYMYMYMHIKQDLYMDTYYILWQ